MGNRRVSVLITEHSREFDHLVTLKLLNDKFCFIEQNYSIACLLSFFGRLGNENHTFFLVFTSHILEFRKGRSKGTVPLELHGLSSGLKKKNHCESGRKVNGKEWLNCGLDNASLRTVRREARG